MTIHNRMEDGALADRLHVARTSRGLSQAQLAELSGVAQPTISRIERGLVADPAFADVVALTATLKITLEALTSPSTDQLVRELRALAQTETAPDESELPAAEAKLGIDDLIAMTSAEFVVDLGDWLHRGFSVLVTGGTGSGKTSFLNLAANAGLPESERVIVVEDTRELSIDRSNVKYFFGNHQLSLEDVIRVALRKRPDRLIVGEIRGPEAYEALRAWNTGVSGGLATIHSSSPDAGLMRLRMYASTAERDFSAAALDDLICRSLDIVVHVSHADGRRLVQSVAQVVGSLDGTPVLFPLYKRDTSNTLRRVASALQLNDRIPAADSPAARPPLHTAGIMVGETLGTQAWPVIFNRFSRPGLSGEAPILSTPHMAVFGRAGTGKHYAAKLHALRHAVLGDRVVVIDRSGEWTRVTSATGGALVDVGAGGCGNPFDFSPRSSDLSGGNPLRTHIAALQDLIGGLVEPAYGPLDPVARSIITQGLRETYKRYGYDLADESTQTDATAERMPTLTDLIRMLGLFGRRSSDSKVSRTTGQIIACLQDESVAALLGSDKTFSDSSPFTCFSLAGIPDELVPGATALALYQLSARWTFASSGHQVVVVDEAHRLAGSFSATGALEWCMRTGRKFGVGFTLIGSTASEWRAEPFLRGPLSSSLSAVLHFGGSPADAAALAEGWGVNTESARLLTGCAPGECVFALVDSGHSPVIGIRVADHDNSPLNETPDVRRAGLRQWLETIGVNNLVETKLLADAIRQGGLEEHDASGVVASARDSGRSIARILLERGHLSFEQLLALFTEMYGGENPGAERLQLELGDDFDDPGAGVPAVV